MTLDRVWRLLDNLGHPERDLPPVIHVAGTNGKGSVVATLRALLEARGKTVHVFTSPHLKTFHERIRIAGKQISEPDLTALLGEVNMANQGDPITFFEITTAAALLAFSRVPADYVLLEVGLGGRLDATNVIENPAVTVITPVSMDHKEYLGSDLASIQREKAGIIKPDAPLVCYSDQGRLPPPIQEKAEGCGAPVVTEGRDWRVTPIGAGAGFEFHSGDIHLTLPDPSLQGAHQIRNSGLALAALGQIDRDFLTDEETVAKGLKSIVWPGRLQRLREGPLLRQAPPDWEVWLDGGHNGAAAAALAAHAERNWSDRPLYLAIAMMGAKEPLDFLRPFAGLIESCHPVWVPEMENSRPPMELAAAARSLGMEAIAAPWLEQVFTYIALRERRPSRILITGSLYLAGAVLRENT
ncbi:MAG: bifunctional folylpolyglutamate synthase/dihydrofolate synthase [Magnetovibrionaceae bacterium]